MSVPAELAVTYEEPESAEPAKQVLPCQGPVVLRAALREEQRAFASPQVRPLPARRAQDINARVPKNVPEEFDGLNGKVRLRCEEIVNDRDLLWMRLEIEGETQNLNRKVRKGHKGKKKGTIVRALFSLTCVIAAN